MKLLQVVCFFTLTCCCCCCYCQPCVRSAEGDLCGTTYTLPNNRTVFAYYGISYAAAPIGDNRFREPQPVQGWIGKRNATVRGPECVQFVFTAMPQMKGNEDCLRLNVFTPKILSPNSSDSELMNVMVYIHGGAFNFGSGKNMNPDYILQNDDIVFVSINYRLGILGFFSTGDSKAPGNNGLKDQVAALEWVQRNIRNFGGDPKKVTIYGISAGGASVHYHLLSPLTTGVFQKAISASGAALLPWSLPPFTVTNSLKLARAIKCMNGDSSFVMECLRKKPIAELYQATRKFLEEKHVTDIPFGPVVEPDDPNGFLCEHPLDLFKNGKVKDIPWMISAVENEGAVPGMAIVTNTTLFGSLDDKWNELAPDMFLYNSILFESQKNNISSAIKKHYFGDQKISNKSIGKLFEALGSRLFYTPLTKVTKLHSSSIKNNVYCYTFKYRGTESFSDYLIGKKDYGVTHGDDQFYIVSWNGKRKNQQDNEVARFLSSKIIAFMKTGNPNTISTDWKPVSKKDEMRCLSIYSPTDQRMENFVNKSAIQFWEAIIPNESDNNAI